MFYHKRTVSYLEIPGRVEVLEPIPALAGPYPNSFVTSGTRLSQHFRLDYSSVVYYNEDVWANCFRQTLLPMLKQTKRMRIVV